MNLLIGYTNPVRAACYAIKSLGVPVDEASFDRLAARRGDASPEQIANGFLIRGCDDIQRLCDMADMVIVSADGIVTAFAAEDWVA